MAQPTKTELRKAYLAKRNALDPAARHRDSGFIRQRLLRMPDWEDAGTVLCYISMNSEVETRKIIEEALGRRKRVIVPVVGQTLQDGSLSELRSLSELVPGRVRNLFEQAPKFIRPAEPQEVEVALIPGIAFDRQGGRLGSGGGYFDRMLARMPNAVRLALAYSMQIRSELLPLLDHDIRMHKIVTESEIILPKVTV
jgi:5-formyltetrahydrofolate cyclo-ligase